MSHVEIKKIVELLKEFAATRKGKLRVILLGGLALQYYGMQDRATIDIDAEIRGDPETGSGQAMEGLFNFLKSKGIPADLGEDISRWSIITMPPGYRERTIEIYRDDLLMISVLHPLDFIISKLRRFTEEDMEDALFVARKFNVQAEEIKKSAEEAILHSAKDTSLFIFRKNIDIFIARLQQ